MVRSPPRLKSRFRKRSSQSLMGLLNAEGIPMARVILAEDEEQIRILVRSALEAAGHEVYDAADGVAALEELDRQPADVVVLDVTMPRLDGWSVLERIKSADDAAISDTPVVMLTGSADTDSRMRGAIEGAVRYIAKPFSVKDLAQQVDDVLAGGPEPVERRRVQEEALRVLVRLDGGAFEPDRRRVKLTALEHRRPASATLTTGVPATGVGADEVTGSIGSGPIGNPRARDLDLTSLTPRQRQVLEVVSSSPSIRLAAECLGISQNAVRDRLDVSAKRLGVSCIADLLRLMRQSTR